jgi:hypothetical protein
MYALMLVILHSCAHTDRKDPTFPSTGNQAGSLTMSSAKASDGGRYLAWGFYDLEIARDGSYVQVTPNRMAAGSVWGVHLNAVKLLEKSPCSNCLAISNAHLLPDGNLSVDISITHPFDTPTYTGFDVRGIIMFPASQYFPDDELRIQCGLDPWQSGWKRRYSSADKGDAELVNTEGWTIIWAPDLDWYDFEVDEGYPIFGYYPGKYASGENLGTINPFRRFHSNENRHMFEVGKTVTVTYIIRPPATGPIKASYAIYAHWAPPEKVPVTNPAEDFGPEANSPMPYEFWVTQDKPIDPDKCDHNTPDAPDPLHCHIKTWDVTYDRWGGSVSELTYECGSFGIWPITPHPSGQPDDYVLPGFCTSGYEQVPDGLPGEWPYLFYLEIDHPTDMSYGLPIGRDFYIAKIAIEEPDGEW